MTIKKIIYLIFAKTCLEALKKRVVGAIDDLVGLFYPRHKSAGTG